MKQLGNLAIICARRADITMTTQSGMVSVRSDSTSETMSSPWDSDKKIERIIREVNFGAFGERRGA